MINLTLKWSVSHSDGTWTNNEIELSMPTVPRIGEVVRIDGDTPSSFIVHRQVEGILHRVDATDTTHIVVRLKS